MPKEKSYRKLQCIHCFNLTMMELRHTHSEAIEHDHENGNSVEAGDYYEILKCPACSEITFRKYFYHEYMDETDDVQYEVLYPMGKRNPIGLPPEILKGYEAANKVRKIDANAYGVLVRRVLEMMCINRNAAGKNLYERLQSLSKSGEIPAKLVDVAKHLKDFGNVGAHPGLGELTDAEVPILDDLCRAILEYVYSAPHLAQKAQDSINAIKK